MSVVQSRFQQKSTIKPTHTHMHAVLKRLQSSHDASQSMSDYLNFCRTNSFLIVLLKAKKTIFSQSLTKNVICRPAASEAVKFISQLDGSQIKESILKNMRNQIGELKKLVQQQKQCLSEQFQHLTVQKVFSVEEVGQLTNLYLSQLMQNMKNSLKTDFKSKQIYGYMHFTWSAQFVRSFIRAFDQQHQNIHALTHSVQLLDFEVEKFIKKAQQNSSVDQRSALAEYKQMDIEQLLQHIPNKSLSGLIQKQFDKIKDQLLNKEKQCEKFQAKISQYEEIIREQMNMLNQQEQQKCNLKEQLSLSQSELYILNRKCQSIQKEIEKLNEQISNINKKQLQPSKGYYYINPLWQKEQLEEKYYIEIIQLQSDLLIEKEQVQNLVSIVLQEIKLSHQMFYDLRAPNFMIYRFDRQILKLMKTTTAFDKISLEQHLVVRQEGLESESSPQMYKSSISTYSEADTEGRMRSERQILHFEITQQESRQQ